MIVYKAIERSSVFELWSYAGIIILGGLLYALSNYLKAVFLALRLPGPPTIPFLGNSLIIKEKDLLTKRAATAFDMYGSIARIWVLFLPYFVILDPHDLQIILSSKKHTEKPFLYRLMHNFLGDGLITSSKEKWNIHRKLIQPVFHLNILEKFIKTFSDASDSFLKKFDSNKDQINISKLVNNCILDILNEAVLGVPIQQKDSILVEESPFRKGKVVATYRITHPWLLMDIIYRTTKTATEELNQKNRLQKFTKKMIEKRRNIRSKGENFEKKSLLDYMLDISESHPEFTEDDIINEACTFMLAGQDSVGAAVALCLFLLAQHSAIQNKCYTELYEIFGNDDRSPTLSDLRDMRYLEMCIKETLRLYPSVPIISRKIGEDIQIGKHVLPAGSNIFITPYATHRLPSIYPDPESFIPERFTPEQCENRHPYAYIPFSAGARNCIGHKFAILEMKTVISRLLRSYELLPVPGKTKLEIIYRITIRASGGLWISLKERTLTT